MFDSLDERIAPAGITEIAFVGTVLTVSGVGNNNNAITISGDDTALLITESGPGTIVNRTNGQFTNGGAIPAWVTGVAVNGNNGTDTITIGDGAGGGLTLTNRSFSATAEFLTVVGDILTDGNNAGGKGGAVTLTGQIALNPVGGVFTSITIDSNVPAPGADGLVRLDGLVTGSATLDLFLIDSGESGNLTVTKPLTMPGTNAVLSIQSNNVSLNRVTLGDPNSAVVITSYNATTHSADMTAGATISITANLDGIGGEGYIANGNLTTTGAVGSISLQTFGTGSITLRRVDAGATGSVSIVSAGFINDANGSLVNVRGGDLTVSAARAISLDTQVATLNAASTTGTGGSIRINNSGALTIAGNVATTDGAIDITNAGAITVNSTITVIAGGLRRNLSMVVNGAGSTITLDNTGAAAGQLQAYGDTATIRAAGAIADIAGSAGDVAVVAGTVVLAAGTGIGGGGDGGGAAFSIDAKILRASNSTSGNLAVFDYQVAGAPNTSPLTVNSLTNANGNVVFDSAKSVIVNGNIVAGGAGSDITITSSATSTGNFDFLAGSISAVDDLSITFRTTFNAAARTTISGNTVLIAGVDPSNPAQTYSLAGNVFSGTTITVNAGVNSNTEILDISGRMSAGTAINLFTNARAAATPLDQIGITGVVTAGTTLSIGQATNVTSTIVSISGTATGNSGVTITGSAAGTTVVSVSGSLVANGGTISIVGGTTSPASSTYSISGAISNTVGGVSITGPTTGTGTTAISVSGAIAAATTIAVTAGTVAGYTGSGIFAVSGSLNAGTTISLGAGAAAVAGSVSVAVSGSLTAGTSTTVQGGAAIDFMQVTGTVTGTATFNGAASGDLFSLAPQTGSAFTVDGGLGTDTLQILTAVSNITSSTGSPITFLASSGFQSWTPISIETRVPAI